MQIINFNHPLYSGKTLHGRLSSSFLEIIDTSTQCIYFCCWVKKITTSKNGITVICYFSGISDFRFFIKKSNIINND